jgi:hypothetical protein
MLGMFNRCAKASRSGAGVEQQIEALLTGLGL